MTPDDHDSADCCSLTTYTVPAVGGSYERRPNEYQRWNRSDDEDPLHESLNNPKKKETLFVISGDSDEEETDCDQSHGQVNMVDAFTAEESDSGDSEWDGEYLIPDVHEGEDEYTPTGRDSLTREEKFQLQCEANQLADEAVM